jgi:hypothetical protein
MSPASVPRQASASNVYGTRSEVAWASAPLPEAAMACPPAQVRLDSANAIPWLSPESSAPALTRAEAGANMDP